jgi:hypothetical protein
MNISYTYEVNDDGTVTFTSAQDNIPQNISGADLSSTENLIAWLNNYRDAYLAGLQTIQPQIAEGITVDEPQTVS